jgi:hypothetical protein
VASGTYIWTITVTDSISGTTGSTTVNVVISPLCASNPGVCPTTATFNFIDTLTINPSTFSLPVSCSIVSYACTQATGSYDMCSNLAAGLISFDTSSGVLLFESHTIGSPPVGTYSLTVTATGSDGSTNFCDYDVIAVDPCSTSVLTLPGTIPFSDQSYTLEGSTISVTWAWADVVATSMPDFNMCGAYTVEFEKSTDGGSTFAALDTNLFTLDSAGLIL